MKEGRKKDEETAIFRREPADWSFGTLTAIIDGAA